VNLGLHANTIAGWFNGISSSTIWILYKSPDYGAYANGGFDIAWNGGINFRVGSSSVDHGYGPTYPDGTWHFFAWTFDGTNMKLYINGQLKEVWAYPYYLGVGTSTLDVGFYGNNNLYFPGMIDGVRIYDAALSASQIQALYLSGQ
jgi:hypothetical protein